MTKERKQIALLKKISDAIFLFYKKHTYHDLSNKNFTMDRYIELVVNGNTNVLRKYKIRYPKAVLLSAYNDIQKQYIELSKNGNLSSKMKRRDRRDRYVKEYNLLIVCGTVLSVQPGNADVIEFLSKADIKGDNLIKKIQAECNVLKSRIAEIDAIEDGEKKKDKNAEKLSLAYYSRIFALLNKHGYKASRNMSVLDFIETIELYKKEVEENNRQVEELKAKRK